MKDLMIKQAARLGSLLFAVLFALAGCNNPLNPPEQDTGGTGAGNVLISLGNGAARTLSPTDTALNGLSYHLTFSGSQAHEAEILSLGENKTVSLAPGNWTITAQAKSGDSVKAEGSWTGMVNAGETTRVSITLLPKTSSGNGTFTYTVTFPNLGASGSKSLTLYAVTEGGSETAVSGTPVTDFTSGSSRTISIPAGFYRLSLRLTDSAGKAAARTEAIHIYAGLTTTGTFTFTEANFGDPSTGGSLSIDRYIARLVDDAKGYSLKYSYTDGEYDYWYLYLGRVEKVPLWTGNVLNYQGRGVMGVSFTNSFTKGGGFQTTTSDTVEHTTETAKSSTHAFKIEKEIGAEVELKIVTIKEGLKLGYEYTWGTSQSWSETVSHTNTYSSYEEWEQTQSKEYNFTLNRDDPIGFYRPTVLGVCDVFVLVAKSRTEGKIYYTYDAFVREPTSGLEVTCDYSADGVFPQSDVSSRLQFDPAWIGSLPSANYPTEWGVYTAASNRVFQIDSEKPVVVIKGTGSEVSGMRIVVNQGRPKDNALRIIIENLKFTAPSGQTAIDASKFEGNLTVEARGTNSITGGSGRAGNNSAGEPGTAAISCSSGPIEIKSVGGTLTLTGGRGGDGHGAYGHAGNIGGHGISASSKVIIKGDRLITIRGGRGGDASSGSGDNSGGTAGDGGHGIYCPNGSVELKNAAIAGGNGGNGGNGGYHAGDWWAAGLNGYNRVGGDGGSGGWGVVANLFTNYGGPTPTGGNKGAVGRKGNGDSGFRNDGRTAGGTVGTVTSDGIKYL